MTNEEKINEIGNLKPINWISDEDLCTYQQGLRRGAFEMAEWKDEQMIEKACEWLKDNIHDYYTVNEFEEWFDGMFVDFKKAMKGE